MRNIYLMGMSLFAVNHVLAMESSDFERQTALSDIRTHLQEKGYIASANIAGELMFPEGISSSLQSCLEAKSKNKELLNHVPGNLDEQSLVIRRSYLIRDSAVKSDSKEERIPGLENLVLHLKDILPADGYFISAFLISDKAGIPYTETPIELSWHQDKFNSFSSASHYDYLFFMVLDEYNFGDSSLGVGLADLAAFEENIEINTGFSVKEESIDSVAILAEIKSKKLAGYIIDQNFVSDGKVIVHKSPVLEKKGRASRRYKVVLRIKRQEKSLE